MKLRVSAVQYPLTNISSFDEFAHEVEHYVKTGVEFSADVIVFPEFLTTQLLSIDVATIDALPAYTDAYLALFKALAAKHNVIILAGTHIVRKQGKLFNVAHLFHPNGQIDTQEKLHITPFEVECWHIQPGDKLRIFDIKGVKVAMPICYDIEFPELSRMARNQGADVLLNPSCTDDKHGFYRVRYCAHARAVENELYVVTTGTVGSLSRVDYMRANTGQAAIITPNDLVFPPAGLLAEGDLNQGMVVTADLDLDLLQSFRTKGSVKTWRDRRLDLYPDVQ